MLEHRYQPYITTHPATHLVPLPPSSALTDLLTPFILAQAPNLAAHTCQADDRVQQTPAVLSLRYAIYPPALLLTPRLHDQSGHVERERVRQGHKVTPYLTDACHSSNKQQSRSITVGRQGARASSRPPPSPARDDKRRKRRGSSLHFTSSSWRAAVSDTIKIQEKRNSQC